MEEQEQQTQENTEQPVIQETQKQSENKTGEDDNIIFIGQKPFMNYVTGVSTQIKTKKQDKVIIKARGKFISRAVDVAEVSVKRFLQDENIKVTDIKIDSEEFENKEGKRVNVSTIEITLEKQ